MRWLFPLRQWPRVPVQAVQETMKTAFEQWGLPEAMRFDNGNPWGNPQIRVPTALALWVCGLGLHLRFSRPRQSTENGVAERSHGVLNGWVEPSTCANYAELCQRLAKFARLQREDYPACQGRTRQSAFPHLYQVVRPYPRQADAHLWQPARVHQYVATLLFTRTVEKNGRITLLTHEYALGKQYQGQRVTIRLDPLHEHWRVFHRDGEVLKTFPARQLTYETIATLRMSYRHFKAKLDSA